MTLTHLLQALEGLRKVRIDLLQLLGHFAVRLLHVAKFGTAWLRYHHKTVLTAAPVQELEELIWFTHPFLFDGIHHAPEALHKESLEVVGFSKLTVSSCQEDNNAQVLQIATSAAQQEETRSAKRWCGEAESRGDSRGRGAVG